MQSNHQHTFSTIPRAEIPRSSFNRSHGYKTTFNSGKLVPFYCDEALPGDTFNLKATLFARLATPVVPIMDNMYLETFYFAVPVRLIWDNWQKFNGEQTSPGASTDYLVPQVQAPTGGWTYGSLSDYFGLPTATENISVSAFWHRAYNLIYNEWFRDQNLVNPRSVPTNDGPDPQNYYVLMDRCKRHDYFTSCLPWPQKGPGVEISIGDTAPIYGNGKALGLQSQTGNFSMVSNGWGTDIQSDPLYSNKEFKYSTAAYDKNVGMTALVDRTEQAVSTNTSGYAIGVTATGESGMFADLSQAKAASINSLRQAFQLQKMQERDARGGSRYTEIIRSHFGVISPDARLQRPEYLGGSSSRVIINPVQQTSATGETGSATPLGNLAAFGVCSNHGNGFTKSFTEHTIILGLVNVRADLTYQRGIPRMFSRSTRYDFYWPALSHLGEQAVLNKEIFAQGTSADEDVFGYQERWAEYRYFPSQITGKFRSNDAQSLDVWHLSQDFSSLPTLNTAFIYDNPPVDRVVAVTTEPQFIFDSFIDLKCARPMPLYSVPGYTDHF